MKQWTGKIKVEILELPSSSGAWYGILANTYDGYCYHYADVPGDPRDLDCALDPSPWPGGGQGFIASYGVDTWIGTATFTCQYWSCLCPNGIGEPYYDEEGNLLYSDNSFLNCNRSEDKTSQNPSLMAKVECSPSDGCNFWITLTAQDPGNCGYGAYIPVPFSKLGEVVTYEGIQIRVTLVAS